MKDQLCVGFVGMDHLGITSATGAAEKGWRVICFDNRNEQVAELNNGLVPFVEPGLKSAIKRNRHLMSFVIDPGELRNCDLVYIALDVPTDSTGLSDLQPIQNLVALVQKHLNADLNIEGILVTMYDNRLNLSRQVVNELKEYFNDKVYKSFIKRNVRLGEAPSHGKPILLYDASSTGAQNYMNLVSEILAANE